MKAKTGTGKYDRDSSSVTSLGNEFPRYSIVFFPFALKLTVYCQQHQWHVGNHYSQLKMPVSLLNQDNSSDNS